MQSASISKIKYFKINFLTSTFAIPDQHSIPASAAATRADTRYTMRSSVVQLIWGLESTPSRLLSSASSASRFNLTSPLLQHQKRTSVANKMLNRNYKSILRSLATSPASSPSKPTYSPSSSISSSKSISNSANFRSSHNPTSISHSFPFKIGSSSSSPSVPSASVSSNQWYDQHSSSNATRSLLACLALGLCLYPLANEKKKQAMAESSSSSSSSSSSDSSSSSSSSPTSHSSPHHHLLDRYQQSHDNKVRAIQLGDELYVTPYSSSDFKIFSGSGNPALAQEVAARLGTQLGRATIGKFADGETRVQLHDNVRGQDVYIIQPTCYPTNDNLMELLLLITTLRRSSANRVVAVMPYYAYARQLDRQSARSTIAGADIALMLQEAGVDHVVAVDLHRAQVQGFYDVSVPVENLDTTKIALHYFLEKELKEPVIVAPSGEAAKRATKFRDLLGKRGMEATVGLMYVKDSVGFVDADTEHHAVVPVEDHMELVGDVKGKDAIIVDVRMRNIKYKLHFTLRIVVSGIL